MNAIRCNFDNKDCFANIHGSCGCLQEQITKKECPFYKSKEQHIKDVKRCIEKNKQRGVI